MRPPGGNGPGLSLLRNNTSRTCTRSFTAMGDEVGGGGVGLEELLLKQLLIRKSDSRLCQLPSWTLVPKQMFENIKMLQKWELPT